nr:putative 39 kda protein in mitochondrial s-1 and s-2 dna [Tanacetum cinerariifolium]
RLTFIESKYIIGDLLIAFENFYPFTQIEIPLLEVPIPSDESSTSQMTNPDIGSTSEVSGSDSSPRRLSENQRSAIKLAVMMSIFAASGVLMSERKNFTLSGRGESHLFGVANDPYGDEESKSYMISSTAIKDKLVLRGLARMIHQYTYYYSVEYETWVENLIIDYFKKIQFIGKSHRLYRLRIRPPLLGSDISRSRILENEEGERCILNYIPNLGEITNAFEDLIMTSIFENAVLKNFLGICYYRFLNEVIINCTCEEDEITFNESVGYALLKEIKLPGDIVSIEPDLYLREVGCSVQRLDSGLSKHSKPSGQAVLKKDDIAQDADDLSTEIRKLSLQPRASRTILYGPIDLGVVATLEARFLGPGRRGRILDRKGRDGCMASMKALTTFLLRYCEGKTLYWLRKTGRYSPFGLVNSSRQLPNGLRRSPKKESSYRNTYSQKLHPVGCYGTITCTKALTLLQLRTETGFRAFNSKPSGQAVLKKDDIAQDADDLSTEMGKLSLQPRPFAWGFLTPFTGPDSPSVDEPCRGALGFWGIGFSPMFALLKPTFSLRPLQLALVLHSKAERSHSFGRAPSPVHLWCSIRENLLALGSSGISPNHNSSADSSTSVGSDLHLVSTKRHPGHG